MTASGGERTQTVVTTECHVALVARRAGVELEDLGEHIQAMIDGTVWRGRKLRPERPLRGL